MTRRLAFVIAAAALATLPPDRIGTAQARYVSRQEASAMPVEKHSFYTKVAGQN